MKYFLKRQLTQTISLATVSGTNSRGNYSYNNDTAYKGRVVKQTKRIQTPDEEEQVSQTQVSLEASANPTVLSRITLPDGTQPKILTVDERYDKDNSTSHWEVACE